MTEQKEKRRYDAPKAGYRRRSIYVNAKTWEQFAKAAKDNNTSLVAALDAAIAGYLKQTKERHG